MRRWRRSSASCSSTSSCQGIAVSSGGETGHRRMGAHGGQLELAATSSMRSCITLVSVMGHPRPATADREQAVADFQVRLAGRVSAGAWHLGLGQVPHLRVVEGRTRLGRPPTTACPRWLPVVVLPPGEIRTYATSARSPRQVPEARRRSVRKCMVGNSCSPEAVAGEGGRGVRTSDP